MRLRMSVVVAVVLMLVALVGAQPNPTAIVGIVTDTAGAALPGVTVRLSGPERRSTLTNERGEFAFANLQPGAYEVRASLSGFADGVRSVVVTAGRNVTSNLQLTVAALAETITVTGESRAVSGGVVSAPAPPPPPIAAPQAGVASGVIAPRVAAPFNTEAYAHVADNALRRVADAPLSTFSIDVDTASYANVRRFLTDGVIPPPGAVRTEEMINYFGFDYPAPRGDAPFAITTELAECPWNPSHRLALIGIQGRALEERDETPRNLVFLIDVSGSMLPADKLPLVRSAMRMLVDVLEPHDRIAVVVYAGASGVVLPSTPGHRKDVIHEAIARLEAGGSTNGAAGLRLAYDIARRHFITGGVNRVILATDGDFNVGVTSHDELVRLIERERESGVFLSVLGVGTGNLKDSTMELLADKGNGNYAYLDSLHEARKVLVREAGGTLVTIAKDVKIQVEFNPATVAAYRLIGYENRVMNNEDFNDDRKDAGEIGAGHSVTALYEIVPAGVEVSGSTVDPLRYQRAPGQTPARNLSELAMVKVRFKEPDGVTSRLTTAIVPSRLRPMSANLGFASAVAEFGMLLRDSEHRGGANYQAAAARARRFRGADEEGYRAEFIRLVEFAANLRERRASR